MCGIMGLGCLSDRPRIDPACEMEVRFCLIRVMGLVTSPGAGWRHGPYVSTSILGEHAPCILLYYNSRTVRDASSGLGANASSATGHARPVNQEGASQLPKALGLPPADTAGTEMTPPSSTRNAKHRDGRKALNPNMGKRAMEETADGGDEHGAQGPDREAKRRCVEDRSTVVPEQGLPARQSPLKRPRESESVGGRSGGDDNGDGSGKRHGAASGKEYAVDTGAEDATNKSDVIECLRGVTNSPVNFLVEDSVEGPGLAALDQGGRDRKRGRDGNDAHGTDGHDDDTEVQDVEPDKEAAGGSGSEGKTGVEVDASSSVADAVEMRDDREVMGMEQEEESVQDDREGVKQRRFGARGMTRRGPRMSRNERKKLKKQEARHA